MLEYARIRLDLDNKKYSLLEIQPTETYADQDY